MRNTISLAAASIMMLAPAPAFSQSTQGGARVIPCLAAAERGQPGEAAKLGPQAVQALRQTLSANPQDVESTVTLARVLSQCLIPGAELTQQAELSAEAVDLLERALEMEPRHWLARYVLAQNYYQAPAFMRRADAAAKEFSQLIELQGDRTEPAIFARPFEFRGLLWLRSGQRDSARAVWSRGASLFPGDSALRARLRALESPPPASAPITDVARSVNRVVIEASAVAAPPAIAEPRRVRRMEVLMSPGAAADVALAIQLQGGATVVGDGADLHARSGDPSETPTFVNGSRVVAATHYESLDGSLFGALDPQVLRSVQFSPGGFSVRIGNALSGALEIQTDGRSRVASSRLGLSSVAASATARAPINRTTGAWASARASHTGPMLWMNGLGGDFVSAPRAVDAIAGMAIEPDARTEVRLYALMAIDDVARDVVRGNYAGTYRGDGVGGQIGLSARRVAASAPVIARMSIAGSGRRNRQRLGVLDRARSERTAVWSGDVEWQTSAAVRLRGGIDVGAFAQDETGRVPTSGSLALGAPSRAADSLARTAAHAGTWTEATIERGRVAVAGGIRADRLPGSDVVTVDPRVNVSFAAAGLRLHASVGRFHQGPWRSQADPTTGAVSRDIATAATHSLIGVESTGEWDWRVEAYDKEYGRFVRGGGPALRSARVRGAEAMVRRPAAAGRWIDGWAVYTATRSRLGLAGGEDVPGSFDVTHALVVVSTLRPDNRWRLGVTSRLATGRPITDVVGHSQASDGSYQPAYGPPNGARLPAYARTDVRLTRLFPKPSGLGVFFVEAINVLDRGNVSGWAYDRTWTVRRPVEQFFSRRTVVVGVEWQR